MHDYLLSVLIRMKEGFILLDKLLQEEFSALKAHEPKKIAVLEFSIQELLQQLMREKQFLGARVRESGFSSLNNWIGKNREDTEVQEVLLEAERAEQQAAGQAEKNNSLADALAEQSGKLLTFFYDKVSSEKEDIYSSRATFNQRRRDAGILRGRL